MFNLQNGLRILTVVGASLTARRTLIWLEDCSYVWNCDNWIVIAKGLCFKLHVKYPTQSRTLDTEGGKVSWLKINVLWKALT